MVERTPCEKCGQLVSEGRRHKHAKSVRHRYAELVRQALSDPFVAFADVAKTLEVSREMIRVIAKEMGLGNGRDRIMARRIAESQAPLKCLPIYGNPEFKISPVYVRGRPDPTQPVAPRKVVINGHLCVIREAKESPSVLENNDEAWVKIGTVVLKEPVEFALYELPKGCPEQGWLVVPRQNVPRRSSDINLREAPKLTGGGFTGRWRTYLNAWQLLKERRSFK